MDAAWVQEFLLWMEQHPNLALAAVFLTAFLEATFLVGLLVPGAVLLFAFCALTATNALELWPTLSCALAGALIGDHLSYLLGYKLRDDLKQIWPMSRYPDIVESGEVFFSRHGGKGVILGRFIGALRPVMPTVAGVAGMRPLHFVIMDLLSMVPWVIAYLLPGVVFGASLNLAAEVGTRLLVLVLVVSLVITLIIWFSRRLFLYVSNHTEALTLRVLDWSQRHRRLGMFGPNLADPDQPETPGLGILAIVLLLSSWLGHSLIWGAGPQMTPSELDAAIHALFQNLHTPWTDTVALAIARMGTWQVYLPTSIAILGGLLMARRTRAAAHWLAAVGFGAVLAIGLNYMLRIPAPVDYYRGQGGGYASGHLIMSTVCYGFLAVLLATRKRQSRRWRYYGVAVTGIALIALARLYIGAQWFSDILLGVVVGVIWVSLLSLGYRRHLPQRVDSIKQMPLAMTVLLLAASLQWITMLEKDRAHFLPQAEILHMQRGDWPVTGFNRLPAYRTDLAETRRYPLNLQWQGRLEDIRNALHERGWQFAEFQLRSGLLWLSKSRPIGELALLPQVHGGRPQALAAVLPIDDQRQWVLRLWPSGWRIDGTPLWLGNIASYQLETLLDNLRIPWVSGDFSTGPVLLRQQFGRGHLAKHQKATAHPMGVDWDATVLLLATSP